MDTERDLLGRVYWGFVHMANETERATEGESKVACLETGASTSLCARTIDVGGIMPQLHLQGGDGANRLDIMLLVDIWAPCTEEGLAWPGSNVKIACARAGARVMLSIRDDQLDVHQAHDVTDAYHLGRSEIFPRADDEEMSAGSRGRAP